MEACCRLIPSLGVVAVSAGVALPAAAQEGPACEDGQPRIVGVVIDVSTEAPLEGAFVSVEAMEQGSLTAGDGRFLLCWIDSGLHVVTAERLGYETVTLNVEAVAAAGPVEVRMQPDPILLEGLEIVSDRFDRRRRAASGAVRAYDQQDLTKSVAWSAAEFVDSRAGILTVPCGVNRCVYRRGDYVNPTVFLDEFELMGGWADLELVPTSHLYMIEVYRGGTHIRAYTHSFMERAAKARLAPLPILERSRWVEGVDLLGRSRLMRPPKPFF
jgi:hypothetical protein